jgi:hypothetical protein
MAQPTLAERLGYRPEDRLLIVSCDDLGSSYGANLAIFRAMVHGVATSASLMVPCPWAREAARMLEGFAIGVYLTLTCEYRGYRWRGLTSGASLHDDEGFLPTTTQLALERVDAADARAECRAQLQTALSWGVDVQARTDLYEIYLDLAAAFRLPVRFRGKPPRSRVSRPASAPRPAARSSTNTSSIHGPGARGTCSSRKFRSCRRA